jgi:hypothetical protein
MVTRNTNISRILSAINGKNNLKSTQDRSTFLGNNQVLHKAIVIEVITDPAQIDEPSLRYLPTNSILGKIISNNENAENDIDTVLFPLFSSHFMLPVKPGETVFAIFEDIKETGTRIGYWISRVPNIRTVEDANYTHHDRKFDQLNDPSVINKTSDREFLNERILGPDFNNGGGGESNKTLIKDKNSQFDPFEQIKQESESFKKFTLEPVPRWNKRPGEYVFQGSNNTIAIFGEDRSGGTDYEDDEKGFSGTIDFIVGRGRFLPLENEDPELTAPRIIKNSRGNIETDKAPYRRGETKKDNVNEGNPDYINDAARWLTSMQMEADRKFQIVLNSAGSLSLPNINDLIGTNNRSFAVGKADHVRLIARKDVTHGIAGTVLLYREGVQDEDLGYFFIDETGKIQIESTKVYLGKSVEEKEPYILWSKFFETRQEQQ